MLWHIGHFFLKWILVLGHYIDVGWTLLWTSWKRGWREIQVGKGQLTSPSYSGTLWHIVNLNILFCSVRRQSATVFGFHGERVSEETKFSCTRQTVIHHWMTLQLQSLISRTLIKSETATLIPESKPLQCSQTTKMPWKNYSCALWRLTNSTCTLRAKCLKRHYTNLWTLGFKWNLAQYWLSPLLF